MIWIGKNSPNVCLSVGFHLILFFSKNNGFRPKMCATLKIDVFIHYNFCRKYFIPRSIFIVIKWKNLLKTFFFLSFYLKNQIFRSYHIHDNDDEYHHHICNYLNNIFSKFPSILLNKMEIIFLHHTPKNFFLREPTITHS